MKRLLRIGTRGSKLALAQAIEVKQALEKAHANLTCELTILKTSGDDFTAWKAKDAAQGKKNPPAMKGLFVKEIEEALMDGRIELAVHSVKDLQTDLPEELKISAVLKRQDPRDALVSKTGATLKDLPAGTSVGASSLRRQTQLMRIRRDLEPIAIRGNVDTRLRKLNAGECGALILAACGLIRLGLSKKISEYLSIADMLPAPGQGALGVEIRADNEELDGLLQKVNDPATHSEIQAERALLRALGGSCQVPIGALAHVDGQAITLEGAVLSPDGLKLIRKSVSGSKEAAEKLGKELASHLRAAGADRLLYGQWTDKQKIDR